MINSFTTHAWWQVRLNISNGGHGCVGIVLNKALTGGLMLVHWVSGYWVAVVIAGEAPSWPQAARVLLYTLINLILAYEFVYKPAKERNPGHAIRQVVGVSLIPYCLGVACVIILFML